MDVPERGVDPSALLHTGDREVGVLVADAAAFLQGDARDSEFLVSDRWTTAWTAAAAGAVRTASVRSATASTDVAARTARSSTSTDCFSSSSPTAESGTVGTTFSSIA